MRVRFGELSKAEAQARERIWLRARAAWACVRAGEEARAEQLMNAIDARVTLSILQADLGDAAGGLRVAELATEQACALPLAELLLSAAPDDVGCLLSLGRPALSLERALEEARQQHALELGRATFRAGFSRGHLLEVTLGLPGGTGSENEQNAAENLVRALLGDRLFETWIGAVHVTPAPRGGPLRVLDATAPRTSLPLRELLPTVSAATLGVLRGLQDSQHAVSNMSPSASVSTNAGADGAGVSSSSSSSSEREQWTLLEVEPVDASGDSSRKGDLVLASTCTPELLRCYLDGSPCASRRFSHSGEHFLFVSYQDDEPSAERRVAKRNVIESALCDSVTGVGAVTGVGLGVRNTYVDLALCNLETGLSHLVSKLRELDAPERTFIQFFDSELSDEWLSIWPDIRLTEE
jgi:hypothetical protein